MTPEAPVTLCGKPHIPEPGHVRTCLEPVDKHGRHAGKHWSIFRQQGIEWSTT